MMRHPAPPAIVSAVNELYEEAGVPVPTVERCVAPLGDLVGSYSLSCTELPNLTGEAAAEFLVQQGSIPEPPGDVNGEKLAGFLYATVLHGSIFVERADRITRRRFSVAHELGHYLLHFRRYLAGLPVNETVVAGAIEALPLGEGDVDPSQTSRGRLTLAQAGTDTTPRLSHEQMEREADQFAGELLMPAQVVEGLVGRYTLDFRGGDLVWRLASDMLVSRAAMRWRLRDFGLMMPDGELV